MCRLKKQSSDTKPNAHEFGEKELRSWYQPQNYLGIPDEVIIDEKSTLDETVSLILETVSK